MNRTKIDWCDYTWNPVIGCLRNCEYCYAKRMAGRFGWDFTPHWCEKNFIKSFPLKPSSIFVGSMTDIFYWKPEWMEKVITKIQGYKYHRFYFLTKQPDVYDDYIFPGWCWLGLTLTGTEDRPDYLQESLQRQSIMRHKKTFISHEPLLKEFSSLSTFWGDWVIIGSMTGPGSEKHQPKREWIEDIIKGPQWWKTPIFMKSNLKKIWGEPLIQEIPE